MTTATQPPPTAVEKRNKELAQNAWGLLQGMKASIAAILPKHLTPERMAMIAFTAMRQNPKLLACSRESIIGSIMTASILGLEPSGPLGHGALIPYKGECQFQPMYQGLLELARRSGLIKDVQLRAVLKGDTYRFRFGLDPTIEHVPLEGDDASRPDRECTHVYCIIRFNNGGIQWDQMSFAEAIAHGKRFSKTWDTQTQKFKEDSPWAAHPVAMAQKTILKRTLKLCPKSVEMSMAMQLDDLGETGKMATLKQDPTTGIFDVDFGGSDEIEEQKPATSQGTSAIDRIVDQNKKSQDSGSAVKAAEGATSSAAPSGVATEAPRPESKKESAAANPGQGGGEPQAGEVCDKSDIDQLEILATDCSVLPKKWKKHIESMGFAAWDLLTKDRLAEARQWIEAQKKS